MTMQTGSLGGGSLNLGVPSKTMSQLKSIADTLNRAANEAGNLIRGVESELADSQVGVEFWSDCVLYEGDLSEADDTLERPRYRDFTVMGYAKVDGEWCLAAKKKVRESGFHEGHENQRYSSVSVKNVPDAVQPLRNASRDIRLNAAAQMDNFLDAYLSYLEEMASVF